MHLTSEKTEIPKWYHFLVHPVYRHENTVGDVGLVSGPVTASPISPAPAYTEYKRTGKCLRHTLILTTSVPDTCHLWRSPAPRRLLETRDPGWSLSPRQSYCGEPRGRRWRRVFSSLYHPHCSIASCQFTINEYVMLCYVLVWLILRLIFVVRTSASDCLGTVSEMTCNVLQSHLLCT